MAVLLLLFSWPNLFCDQCSFFLDPDPWIPVFMWIRTWIQEIEILRIQVIRSPDLYIIHLIFFISLTAVYLFDFNNTWVFCVIRGDYEVIKKIWCNTVIRRNTETIKLNVPLAHYQINVSLKIINGWSWIKRTCEN